MLYTLVLTTALRGQGHYYLYSAEGLAQGGWKLPQVLQLLWWGNQDWTLRGITLDSLLSAAGLYEMSTLKDLGAF